MNNFKKTKVSKITSVFLSATTAIWLSGAAALVPMAVHAQTVDELQTQISALLAQISQLQAQLSAISGGTTGGTACGYTFSVNLTMGSTGTDVMNLQKVLNSDSTTQVASSGVGSLGNETSYFGSLTKAAVVKFQDKYASEVLTPLGLSAGTGYFGASSRAKMNALSGVCPTSSPSPTGTGTGTPLPTPTGDLTVTAASQQPTSSLFPVKSTRVPFTIVDFTAQSGDVTVSSLTIERTGLADDNVFAGVSLLDENGMQIGLAKTLNSVHQVLLNEPFVVKSGQTRRMTIAGDAQTAASSRAGQVAFLSLVAVSASGSVGANLPITGSSHTISETLTIGSLSPSRGSLDPGTAATKSIGTLGYTFSSAKFTAGSNEKVRLMSIRWNQSGSASASDLLNVATYVDGVGYPTVVSSDGKYFTSSFGSGILIDKGFSKELTLKGDIEGGAARTIDFDIYKRTDLYAVGETFGYGITPDNGTDAAGTDDSAFHLTTNPWYDASEVIVSNGTMNVTKASSVAAQNLAINLANQVLGGFEVEVKGEQVSVASTVFHFQITSTNGQVADITNISLYDANGNVVAGPQNGSGGAVYGTVTFSDTITYPIGKGIYTLKGTLGTDFANNQTIVASTTPTSDWTNRTGLVTGNSITPTPASAVSANTMTVRSSALAISASAAPVNQNVVAGVSGFTFANYIFDSTQSGEDIRVTSIPLAYGHNGTASANNLSNCALWDGSQVLNTGSNIVNPTAQSSSTSFTFDGSGLTIPKGTSKSLALKCDIAGNTSTGAAFLWGLDFAQAATFAGATGMTSGQEVTETMGESNGQTMTTAAGGLTVALDSSSPSYTLASSGASDVTLAVLRFSATNEEVRLNRIALQLTGGASNTPIDLAGSSVTLWDGSTQVGTAVFASSDYATSTLSQTVLVPKSGYKRITVKATIGAIGTSQPATQGHLIKVDWDGDGGTGTQGTGQSAGGTLTATGSDTSSSGVRIFRSVPTFTKLSAGSSKVTAGNLSLYRWKITADSAGDIGIAKFTVKIATSSATSKEAMVDSVNIYAYSDSGFSTPVSGVGASGEFLQTAWDTASMWASSASPIDIGPQTIASASTTVQIPAGGSVYFEVRADVTTAGATYSIATQIEGDAAYIDATGFTENFSDVNQDDSGHNDFIWSANATTTTVVTVVDWSNGYGIPGLPSTNMNAEILTQ